MREQKLKESKYKEYCEICGEESTSAKVRWDLECPLVLCDNCYFGFKTNPSVQNTKEKKNKMESRT
jgi:ribosome-binding protein aMBF1 (putative translation factor)